MNLRNKKVGIWGLGVSGTALFHYLAQNHQTLNVLDRTHSALPPADHAKFFSDPYEREAFLDDSDIVVPSPGIDLRPHSHYQNKIICEVDLFQALWKKPIIGITGTLGKTSITHLLSALLNKAGATTATGGNIGVGMFDLFQSNTQQALLELSSFQLEHARSFAPDLAIWTNFFPNHLDRHTTLRRYFEAKTNIFAHQKSHQKLLLPLEIADHLHTSMLSTCAFFASERPHNYTRTHPLYYYDADGTIMCNDQIILEHQAVPAISYRSNWLIICATLDLLGYDAQKIITSIEQFTLPHYRLERIATIDGVTYYNDSKATIMQATIAAVHEIQNGPIILMLGGTSKGVDRSSAIAQLTNNITHAICFGYEAERLKQSCLAQNIQADAYIDLESALHATTQQATAGTSVLFSPGGASFDLFSGYQERGKRFKELVLNLQQNSKLELIRKITSL